MTPTRHSSRYPLTLPALAIGLAAGAATALVTLSLLIGFAVFTFFALVGGTWRRDEAPVVPFILASQWLVVTVGYFYRLVTGVFPSLYPPGNVERTIVLSLSGLLVLAAGMRIARWAPAKTEGMESDEVEVGNLTGLFWLVMIVYGVDYVHVINTKVFSSIDVILARLLDFRQVLLLVLWFEVVRRRTHLSYLWITLAWVFVPLLGSYFSDFKLPLFLLLIVYMSFWTPWQGQWWHVSLRQVLRTTAVVVLLMFLALIWQAGVKKQTRLAYDTDIVGNDPIDRVTLFVESAATSLPIILDDTDIVVEGLIERISYITFFSRVLDHVPHVQPHTNGELLNMAVTNTVMPRFAFPDKPALPSDSVYTRRFTGIWVPEQGTSISIGYMAEFYVDWGERGMMFMIFLYGCWIGLAARVLSRWVRPRILVDPAIIVALMAVSQFEHQFIKTFAALNLAVIVTVGITVILRAPLTRFLHFTPLRDTAPEFAPEASTR